MKTTLRIAILLLCTLTASAQLPVVQAHLQPASGILVGQPVHLVITVYVPNYFTGEPTFPEFEIENAIVVLPQDRPTNSNTQINGITYGGITETYVIYPQQQGDFHLPPAKIAIPYAVAPPKTTTTTATLPALSFHADIPAAAKNLDYFLPTTSLTIQQRWSSPLKDLHTGDSVERTITVTAVKMQAMLIPPLPLDAPNGLRVYPDQPSVQNQKTDRGDFVYGRRTQTVKYFIQKEGDYTLPPIDLKWWSLSTNHLVTATLPAVHFTALKGLATTPELAPEPEPTVIAPTRHVNLWKLYRHRIFIIAVASILAILLAWAARRFIPPALRKVREHREHQKHSEATYYHNLRRACTRNDAIHSYHWLLKWLALTHPGATIREVAQKTDSPALLTEADALGAVLFANNRTDSAWRGAPLSNVIAQHRKHHIQRDRSSPLPALNPTQPA